MKREIEQISDDIKAWSREGSVQNDNQAGGSDVNSCRANSVSSKSRVYKKGHVIPFKKFRFTKQQESILYDIFVKGVDAYANMLASLLGTWNVPFL